MDGNAWTDGQCELQSRMHATEQHKYLNSIIAMIILQRIRESKRDAFSGAGFDDLRQSTFVSALFFVRQKGVGDSDGSFVDDCPAYQHLGEKFGNGEKGAVAIHFFPPASMVAFSRGHPEVHTIGCRTTIKSFAV